jgi:hypothetical protein
MRTLLRHPSTGQYFQSLNRWTSDPDSAHDFALVRRALRFARKAGLTGLELVVSVEDPQKVSSTPFEKFWRELLRSKATKTAPTAA